MKNVVLSFSKKLFTGFKKNKQSKGRYTDSVAFLFTGLRKNNNGNKGTQTAKVKARLITSP